MFAVGGAAVYPAIPSHQHFRALGPEGLACSLVLNLDQPERRVTKNKPRAIGGPGRNLSSYETNYQQREIRSQGYLKSLPVPRPPSNFPTQKLGRCGPGGTRTRTL